MDVEGNPVVYGRHYDEAKVGDQPHSKSRFNWLARSSTKDLEEVYERHHSVGSLGSPSSVSNTVADVFTASMDSQEFLEHALESDLLPEIRSKVSHMMKRAERAKQAAKSDNPVGEVQSFVTDRLINDFLKLTWPNLVRVLEQTIEQSIQGALDRATRNLGLKGMVKFENVRLSDDHPPDVGPIHTYKRRFCEQDALEIDMGVRWSTTLGNFDFSAGPIHLGVQQVSFCGILGFQLKPLLPRKPFIGGISVSFLSPPDLHFRLTGVGAVIPSSSVDFMAQWMLTQVLADLLVLPRSIPIWVNHTVVKDLVNHKSPPPIGVLRVRVLEARGLFASDWNLTGPPSSDPYCRLRLGGIEHRTKTVNGTVEPVWSFDDFFDFPVYNERQRLDIQVFDEDVVSSDDFLGCLQKDRQSVFELLQTWETDDQDGIWLQLDTSKVDQMEGQQIRSKLHLQVQYLSVSSAPPFHQAQHDGETIIVGVRIFMVNGTPELCVQGATLKLSVGGAQPVTSLSCGAVPPLHAYGLAAAEIDLAFRLHSEFNMSFEEIASALGPDIKSGQSRAAGIEEAIMYKRLEKEGKGRGTKMGWNVALFSVALHKENETAKLELFRKGSRKGELLANISLTELREGQRRQALSLGGTAKVDAIWDTFDLWSIPSEVAHQAFADGVDFSRPGSLEEVVHCLSQRGEFLARSRSEPARPSGTTQDRPSFARHGSMMDPGASLRHAQRRGDRFSHAAATLEKHMGHGMRGVSLLLQDVEGEWCNSVDEAPTVLLSGAGQRVSERPTSSSGSRRGGESVGWADAVDGTPNLSDRDSKIRPS